MCILDTFLYTCITYFEFFSGQQSQDFRNWRLELQKHENLHMFQPNCYGMTGGMDMILAITELISFSPAII